MKVRLRSAYDLSTLMTVYPMSYDHTRWSDHVQRVNATIDLARRLCPTLNSVADLSCGDGMIASSLDASSVVLGDLVPGHDLVGPIEETLLKIGHVDLFICSETIEHLDDPDRVLVDIRRHADHLVLSTPIGEISCDNPEHYWGWDQDAVREMLTIAGWIPVIQEDLVTTPRHYDFQLWGCR